MTKTNKHISPVFFISLLFLLFACSDNNDEVIASVGSKKLKHSEIEFIYPKLYSQNNYKTQKKIILKKWIDTELLYQEAKKHRSKNNYNIDQKTKYYKKQLIVQAYLDDIVYKNISISNSEIFERYKKNKGLYIASKPIAIVINYLTNSIEESEKIKNILTLSDKAEINLLNNKYSVKQQIIKKGSVVPKVEKEIFSSYNKKIIGPIKIKAGFVVIKILKKIKKGEQIPLVFVKNEIKEEILLEKQNNSYKNLLKKIRKKNKVKTYEKNN
ncbi:MAG: hypothetical protein U9R41_01010 [Candidatus Marinimicrobia bacterium]|nr:hypothetical protein [Candidatus Neomarinimicrobiota bacterium]